VTTATFAASTCCMIEHWPERKSYSLAYNPCASAGRQAFGSSLATHDHGSRFASVLLPGESPLGQCHK
jgi:hypothetical protein